MPASDGVKSHREPSSAVAAVTSAVLFLAFSLPGCGNGQEAEIRRLLDADQAEDHKRGAWLAAETGHLSSVEELIDRVDLRVETPDVREAYVHSLGLLADPRATDVLAAVIADEDSGYVRQAAWLGLARVNADAFEKQADAPGPDSDVWDRIGVAQGRMELGDYRDVPVLIAVASSPETWQGDIAARAIQRWVSPLLDAVGKWPLELAAVRAEDWSAEQVAEIADRIAGTGIQAIADDTLPHLEKSRRVQSNEAKLNKARDRIARVLFWALADEGESAP